jgi:hypothetical protein
VADGLFARDLGLFACVEETVGLVSCYGWFVFGPDKFWKGGKEKERKDCKVAIFLKAGQYGGMTPPTGR